MFISLQAVLRLLSGLAATEGVGTMLKGDELAGLTDIPAQPTTENGQAHPKAMMIGFAGARLMCFLSGMGTHITANLCIIVMPRTVQYGGSLCLCLSGRNGIVMFQKTR